MDKSIEQKTCSMCGLCCQLFLINLNETEYRSGRYQTVFPDLEIFDDFDMATSCGANIVAQKNDGSCIYLVGGKCTIHEARPAVCREFFCRGTETKFEGMRADIDKARFRGVLQ